MTRGPGGVAGEWRLRCRRGYGRSPGRRRGFWSHGDRRRRYGLRDPKLECAVVGGVSFWMMGKGAGGTYASGAAVSGTVTVGVGIYGPASISSIGGSAAAVLAPCWSSRWQAST